MLKTHLAVHLQLDTKAVIVSHRNEASISTWEAKCHKGMMVVSIPLVHSLYPLVRDLVVLNPEIDSGYCGLHQWRFLLVLLWFIIYTSPSVLWCLTAFHRWSLTSKELTMQNRPSVKQWRKRKTGKGSRSWMWSNEHWATWWKISIAECCMNHKVSNCLSIKVQTAQKKFDLLSISELCFKIDLNSSSKWAAKERFLPLCSIND